LVRQKDTRPANFGCGATYTNDINLNWGGGVLTGTAFGGATVASGKLDLRNFDKYIRYAALNNASSTQVGCIRFLYTPNYSGAPVAERTLIALLEALGSSTSLIQLSHNTAGRIGIFITNSSGVTIVNGSSNIISLVAGTEYEFEFDWDLTAGITNLFLNGVKIITTITSTGSRNAASYIYIGANFGASNKADGYFNNVLFFSVAQHTANYTPGYTIEETIYVENKVTLPEMEYTGAGSLIVVTNFITSFVQSPRITLQIGRSGDWLYWDGVEWAVSNDTYTQANDPAIFAINVATLPVSGEIYVQFKIYFTGSNTLSSFLDLSITLTAQIYLTNNPTIEINSKWYIDALELFSETAAKIGTDQIKYILKKGTKWYYWNGSAWVESNGTYTQANTAADIEIHKANFTTSHTLFGIKLFLYSTDGTTTPEIDLLSVDFDYAGETADTINTCIVWGYLIENNNVPSDDQIIIFLNKKCAKYKTNILVTREEIRPIVREDGYFEIELIETINMDVDTLYDVRINGKHYTMSVPNDTEQNINELLIEVA
jgi:hypothetical protein